MLLNHSPHPYTNTMSGLVDVNDIVAAANEFKPLNPTIVRLSSMILDPFTGTREMAKLIAFDQALTIKLLKAANSAYIGSAMRITNVGEAISFIGEYQTLNLLLSCTIGQELLAANLAAYGYAEGQLWRESVIASLAAEQCGRMFRTPVPQVSTTSALLYNVGKVVMSRFIKEDVQEYISLNKKGGQKTADAEMEILNVHYGEIGGLIAQHWGLPHEMVVGISFHHNPDTVCSSISDVTHVCHSMVEHLKNEAAQSSNSHQVNPNVIERLDPRYDNWLEKLEAYVCDRFSDVAPSYGLKADLTPKATAVT